MKNKTRISVLFVMLLVATMLLGSVYGSSPDDSNSEDNTIEPATLGDNFLGDIINQANGFFGESILNALKGEAGFLDLGDLFNTLINLVFTLGNLIILCAIAIMGLRYVWSGVAEKASIKESAINMSVGVVFFYMAQGIYTFATSIISGLLVGQDGTVSVTDFTGISNNIWSTLAYVVRVLALIGFAATGIKYMMTSADTRADLKKRIFPVIVGLIIIFCMTEIIEFIITATQETLNVDNGVNDVVVPNENEGDVNEDIKDITDRIWGTAKVIIQILAVGVMVGTGVRYMFTSADTKADIKKQTIILLAGAAMVFGALEVISLIQNIGKDVFK